VSGFISIFLPFCVFSAIRIELEKKQMPLWSAQTASAASVEVGNDYCANRFVKILTILGYSIDFYGQLVNFNARSSKPLFDCLFGFSPCHETVLYLFLCKNASAFVLCAHFFKKLCASLYAADTKKGRPCFHGPPSAYFLFTFRRNDAPR
jgi:hypothetical protein